jgi:single-stranded DNA-binding protein
MSTSVMLAGALGKTPQQRMSKAGKPYMSTSIRVTEGSEVVWWNLLIFAEAAQIEILRLDAGEKLAVQGVMRLEIYQKDGEPKISRTVIVDHVVTLRQPPKTRAPKTDRQAPTLAPELDDDLPWGGPDR